MRKAKKIISMLLAFTMICTMCSFPSLAEELITDGTNSAEYPEGNLVIPDNEPTDNRKADKDENTLEKLEIKTVQDDDAPKKQDQMTNSNKESDIDSAVLEETFSGEFSSVGEKTIYTFVPKENKIYKLNLKSRLSSIIEVVLLNSNKESLIDACLYLNDRNLFCSLKKGEVYQFEVGLETTPPSDEKDYTYTISLERTNHTEDELYEIENGILKKINIFKEYPKNISIPEGVTRIDGAFPYYNDFSFDSITFPASLTLLGYPEYSDTDYSVFSTRCFYVKEENPAFTAIDGILYNKEGTTLIRYPNKEEEVFSLDEKVTEINSEAFNDKPSFKKLILTNNLKRINDYAFSGCSKLRSIEFKEGLEEICDGAFSGCENLSDFEFPESLQTIGAFAFDRCNISSVRLPKALNDLSVSAFFCCKNLECITVADGNEFYHSEDGIVYTHSSIALYPYAKEGAYEIPEGFTIDWALKYTGEITEVTFPKNWGEDDIFSFGEIYIGSLKLENIHVKPGNENLMSRDGILYSTKRHDGTCVLIQYPANKNQNSYTIPNDVFKIEDNAFSNSKSLTSITVPKTVTYIGENAFGENVLAGDSLTIKGYDDSAAHQYYIENSLESKGVIWQSLGATSDKDITENDLFYQYSKHLNNATYKKMCSTLNNDMAEIVWSRSGNDNILSAAKSAMMGGATKCIKSIWGAVTGKFYDESDLEEAIALEYVQKVSEDSNIASEILDSTSKKIKFSSKVYTIFSEGVKTIDEEEQVCDALAIGMFEKNDVRSMFRNTEHTMDKISKKFKKAGKVVSSAEIVLSVIMTMQAEQDLVSTLMSDIPKESALYKGLNRISKKLKKSVAENLITEFLENEVFDKMADTLKNLGIERLSSLVSGTGGISSGGALAVASIGYAIAGYNIKAPAIENVEKAIISNSNNTVLLGALEAKKAEILQNYKDKDRKNVEKLKKEYSILYSTYLLSIKNGVSYCLAIANKKDKENLEAHYANYKNKLSYRKYIKSCLKNANTEWFYTEDNGKARITGYKITETTETEEKVQRKKAREGTEELYCLDIPTTVDDYEVEAIDKSSFKNNEEIEGVNIPDSVASIDSEAFASCTNLNTIFLGRNVSTIGDHAFANCMSLKEIDLPTAVQNIGPDAFTPNNSLAISGTDSSYAEDYAQKAGIDFKSRRKQITDISVKTAPQKLIYTMLEDLDTTGLVIQVIYEDGSAENINSGIFCTFEKNKVIGQNKVNVNYDGCLTTYDVTVSAVECPYTVAYQNEYGEDLKEKIRGSSMAGETLTLTAPKIDGYQPEFSEQSFIIGEDNNFVLTYIQNPKINLKDVQVSYQKEFNFTGNQIRPDITLLYNGGILKEGEDYNVTYDKNINAGDGRILIWGTGKYTGDTWITFKIKGHNKENIKPLSTKVTKIKINGISKKIAAGKKIKLNAVVHPKNAANRSITWTSSNKKVATVNNYGIVTLKKKSGGKSVTITATAKDGSKIKGSYKITSMKGVVKKISLFGKTKVKAGKSLKIQSRVIASKKANTKLKWTCSNSKYATVTQTGKVKTYKAGKGKKTKISALATDGSGKKKSIVVHIQ